MPFDPLLVERYAENEAQRMCYGFDALREAGTIDQKLVEDMDLDQRMISLYNATRTQLAGARETLREDLRERIAGFRADRSWRWKYEAYEIFCAEEAMEIRARFGAIGRFSPVGYMARQFAVETLRALRLMDRNQILERLSWLRSVHTTRSLHYSLDLAIGLMTGTLGTMHGALACVVGCDNYGCHRIGCPEPSMVITAELTLPPGDHDWVHAAMEYPLDYTETYRAALSNGTTPRINCQCAFCRNHRQFEQVLGCRCPRCSEHNQRAIRDERIARRNRQRTARQAREATRVQFTTVEELRLMLATFSSSASWEVPMTWTSSTSTS